jgi:demethylmenaquinone methyltransferase/2-methoxy-6-polyprenyl-1,4-benzoquinol methylase
MTNQKSDPSESPAPISRVPRTRDQARNYYDRLSSIYDWLAGSEWKYTRQAVDLLALQPGERSLEIGFGTGRALVEMAWAVGKSGCAHGIDISSGMLAVARDKLETGGVSQQACLLIGDALHLPYAPACLDAILMSFTLELFDTPDIPRVLAGCRRVLKPTGRLAIVALTKTDQPGLVARAYEWGHTHFPALLDCRPIFPGTSLRTAGFLLVDQQDFELYGLPVSIVLASLHPAAQAG